MSETGLKKRQKLYGDSLLAVMFFKCQLSHFLIPNRFLPIQTDLNAVETVRAPSLPQNQYFTKISIHHHPFHHIARFNNVNACGVDGYLDTDAINRVPTNQIAH